MPHTIYSSVSSLLLCGDSLTQEVQLLQVPATICAVIEHVSVPGYKGLGSDVKEEVRSDVFPVGLCNQGELCGGTACGVVAIYSYFTMLIIA